jgi:hypothetical protein
LNDEPREVFSSGARPAAYASALAQRNLLAAIASEDKRRLTPVRLTGSSRKARRLAILAAGTGVALAVPALAATGELRSLLRFSNSGTKVELANADLFTASALDTTGATGTLKLLASRGAIGVYASNDANGNPCYFVGPPNGRLESGLSGGCLNAAASGSFPSPSQPAVDMSAFVYRPGGAGEGITRLAGVAADGVSTIRVIGLDCEVMAEVPVRDNVYAATKLPERPAAGIVGFDEDGTQVFAKRLASWETAGCGN